MSHDNYDDAERDALLAKTGCECCAVDDPERLDVYPVGLPACDHLTGCAERTKVLCDEHASERPNDFLDMMLRRAARINARETETRVAAVLVYECGNVNFDRVSKIRYSHRPDLWADDHPTYTPSGAVRCECGAPLDYARERPFGGDGDE